MLMNDDTINRRVYVVDTSGHQSLDTQIILQSGNNEYRTMDQTDSDDHVHE